MPCQDHDQSILSAEVSYNLFHYNGLCRSQSSKVNVVTRLHNGLCRSQSSKVDVVTRLHTRQLRNHYLTPAVLRYSLFFSKVFRLPLGPTKPSIQWLLRMISLRVKWLGCGINHLPLSVEVRNEWSCNFLPLCAFMMYAETLTLPSPLPL